MGIESHTTPAGIQPQFNKQLKKLILQKDEEWKEFFEFPVILVKHDSMFK